MHGHDPTQGISHSEDALRRQREAGRNPGASRRDHRGRAGLGLVLAVLGAVVVLWIVWSNLVA